MIREKYLLDGEEGKDHIDRIIRASQRMNDLITDVLNYSELSALNGFSDTDINQLIREIMGDIELLIQEKKATIEVGKIPNLQVIPSQMRQVFQNILSNALKFSKADIPPVIKIRAELVAEKSARGIPDLNGEYCRIEVEDNGIGFDEIYLDRIFAIFQRLHSRGQYEGTGIGLAIVKKIIERHDGLITARSKEGVGSTFIIVIPVKHQNNV
jgi:signal transduction histidine kinase